MDEDDMWMRQAAAGDSRAFGRIVARHQTRLVRVAARLLSDPELAQDAAQEAFLRLWRARHRYQPSGRLAALLLKITRNVCLDRAGRTEAEEWTEAREAAQAHDDPAAQAEGGALAEAVRRAVGSLSEPSRTVFILSHYEGLSYADIAAALDCPLGTVASRKRLAVEALRRKLAHWVEGETTK